MSAESLFSIKTFMQPKCVKYCHGGQNGSANIEEFALKICLENISNTNSNYEYARRVIGPGEEARVSAEIRDGAVQSLVPPKFVLDWHQKIIMN